MKLEARPVRIVLLVCGVGLVVVALVADRLGLGRHGGIGKGQVLLTLLGAGLVLIAVLGNRFIRAYRALAIVLLNTVILILILEVAAIAVARAGLVPGVQRDLGKKYGSLPYYAAQEWSADYWEEAGRAEQYRYIPYVGWRHVEFHGRTVNVDSQGRRMTPGGQCGGPSSTLFTFGGSAMWGWGSPDWETIPAHLQALLSREVATPTCVVNYAEDGHVSTQGIIELMRQLKRGNVPDVALFHDGVNEIIAAARSRTVGVHTAVGEMTAKFEDRRSPTTDWIKASRLYWLVDRILVRRRSDQIAIPLATKSEREREKELEALAARIADNYLANLRLVRALAAEYGFSAVFFWQPHLAASRKQLTAFEKDLMSRASPELIALTRATYSLLAHRAAGHPDLMDLSGAFDSEESTIWIDEWGHITPDGNRILADHMAVVIRTRMAARRASPE